MVGLKSVLVVGGGSAGLTCATYLRQAGTHVEVVEIRPHATGGAALGLASNALLPLRGIGALDEVLAHSTPNVHMHVCDSRGATIADIERPAPEGLDFPVNVVITRRELARILWDIAAKAGVTLTTTRQITALTPMEDGVQVQFNDGLQRSYDAVIGADGVGSTVRGLIWGAAPISVVGEAGWRWMTPARASNPRGAFYLGSGGTTLGLFPVPNGELYAVMGEPCGDGVVARSKSTRADVAQRLSSQFTGAFATDVLADLPDDASIHFGQYPALLMDKPWHRGRVLLIGDAAHALPPHSSSGAAMAIEDGAVLAQCLAAARTWEVAMTLFTARRWPRVKQVFDLALQRVRSKDDPSAKALDDPATWERVRSLWRVLQQPI
ncbi:FAD-dependent monooxygenase [Variovorax sp. GB1R11]|uniref:FAD-dependent monooxygenase n=1 Tax=Variovorax sp. GB1R11 TaxID=3443741 RepID=UPI003F488AF5